ncbi:uncharacterized protein UV8b_03116 [Ustilaginoidea virens]|uniref:Uncharacterized protein n=1 Tax=Ustilaginoidea virens TaxID=1159556 RepID=A0A8E5HNS2_USTVR|nr:uncharacterized protein UV8b_03116 [Ustilaginoidea virens]QUC18875.1 hypothetical protein UV8b_03116 [Ustilaginoidea virens]
MRRRKWWPRLERSLTSAGFRRPRPRRRDEDVILPSGMPPDSPTSQTASCEHAQSHWFESSQNGIKTHHEPPIKVTGAPDHAEYSVMLPRNHVHTSEDAFVSLQEPGR